MGPDQHSSAPSQPLLGEILLRRGRITSGQLEQALKEQEKERSPIGEILVKLGFAQEQDIVVALVVQCNLPYIAIDKYDLDPEIIKMIPPAFARQHLVVPLDRVDNTLSIVMADPLNEALKKTIEQMTKQKVAPFIATKAELQRAVDRWYA